MRKFKQRNSPRQEAGAVPSVYAYGTDKKVQVIFINNEPHFIANEICDILGYGNARDALYRHVDEDDKLVSVITTSGQRREVNIITESGLYSLILRSNKPEAKPFQKWVTKEVLPSIRKTGSYTLAEGKPFMGITPISLEGTYWYPYSTILKALGFSTRSGAVAERKKRFPQHFHNIYGLNYVTLSFAEYLRKSREALQLSIDFATQNALTV